MKGIVFTELLELVEEKFGYETVDQIISAANLENDGAFTAIGTYDHNDLLKMVVALSQQVGVPVPVLVNTFGKHLFNTCLLYTSPSPRDKRQSRMPSSA